MSSSHICGDFYVGFPFTPKRVRAAECTEFADQNRWINFLLSLDLTPDPNDDDPASGLGAWSVSDIPATYTAQIDDTTGKDILLVAIKDRVFQLDWTRFRDEWNWDVFAPIYRRITLGAIPYTVDTAQASEGDPRETYAHMLLKRFRRLYFYLKEAPTDAETKYRISVQEVENDASQRQGVRVTAQRNKAEIAVVGTAFEATIEHEANEQFTPLWWIAEWDVLGERFKHNEVTTA